MSFCEHLDLSFMQLKLHGKQIRNNNKSVYQFIDIEIHESKSFQTDLYIFLCFVPSTLKKNRPLSMFISSYTSCCVVFTHRSVKSNKSGL